MQNTTPPAGIDLATKVNYARQFARLRTDLEPENCRYRAALPMEEAERIGVPMLHLVCMPASEISEESQAARAQALADVEHAWEYLVKIGRGVRRVEKEEPGTLAEYLLSLNALPWPIARLAVAASMELDSAPLPPPPARLAEA